MIYTTAGGLQIHNRMYARVLCRSLDSVEVSGAAGELLDLGHNVTGVGELSEGLQLRLDLVDELLLLRRLGTVEAPLHDIVAVLVFHEVEEGAGERERGIWLNWMTQWNLPILRTPLGHHKVFIIQGCPYFRG